MTAEQIQKAVKIASNPAVWHRIWGNAYLTQQEIILLNTEEGKLQ